MTRSVPQPCHALPSAVALVSARNSGGVLVARVAVNASVVARAKATRSELSIAAGANRARTAARESADAAMVVADTPGPINPERSRRFIGNTAA